MSWFIFSSFITLLFHWVFTLSALHLFFSSLYISLQEGSLCSTLHSSAVLFCHLGLCVLLTLIYFDKQRCNEDKKKQQQHNNINLLSLSVSFYNHNRSFRALLYWTSLLQIFEKVINQAKANLILNISEDNSIGISPRHFFVAQSALTCKPTLAWCSYILFAINTLR